MRVLVVLPGEAFRNKETGSRDQRRASESQVRFFRQFPSITFDVFLNVYAHPALETLKSWYPNCVRCTYHFCNSATGWNPFYVIVGRDESKSYPHEGFRYDIQTRTKTYNAGDVAYRKLRSDLEMNVGT
jgi:hypothetical protein